MNQSENLIFHGADVLSIKECVRQHWLRRYRAFWLNAFSQMVQKGLQRTVERIGDSNNELPVSSAPQFISRAWSA
jgi:hypothetical protein